MKLEVPLAVHDRLLLELADAGRVEIGGVLMAEQLAPGEFRLVDFTVDSRRGSAAHFVRSVDEHRDALAAFFQRTGADYSRFNYLGEWHSHPNHEPIPSREDSASMAGLVEGDEGIPFAALLVVRRYRGALTLSATLFQRGQPPAPIDILAGDADVHSRPSGRDSDVSKTSIPAKIKTALWARAAGRCEYRGCNLDLVGDLIGGKEDRLYGFVAHIVADVPGGPRGDLVRSPKLAKKLENLMLMCARHHKLIDEDWEEYSEADLIAMKEAHEARIETNGGIGEEYASYVLRFGASIGANQALVSTQSIFAAMPPDRHPASRQTIDLEMVNQAFQDNELAYWTLQRTNLQRLFADRIGGRIERQEIRHLSVFALAPQPLLIELGRLLYDIVPTTVHQKLREPEGWKWQRDKDPLAFITTEPSDNVGGPIALKLAVSAAVDDERIRGVLGADAAIWSVTIAQPGNDVVRRPEDLAAFRQTMREVYAAIKARHGEGKTINLFPVLPASLAVEAGRVWMPKADLALRIFDHVRDRGFVETFTIGD